MCELNDAEWRGRCGVVWWYDVGGSGRLVRSSGGSEVSVGLLWRTLPYSHTAILPPASSPAVVTTYSCATTPLFDCSLPHSLTSLHASHLCCACRPSTRPCTLHSMTATALPAHVQSRPSRARSSRSRSGTSTQAQRASINKRSSRNATARSVSGGGTIVEEDEEAEDDSQLFVVEAVRDVRHTRGGRQFLVKWQGYEDCTWEPERQHSTARHTVGSESRQHWTDRLSD